MKKLLYFLIPLTTTLLFAETTQERFAFLEEACKRNHYGSCSRLALDYEENILVEQDFKKAFKLYTKACGGGDAFGCHNVAVYYSKEDNPALKKLSVNFYEMGCENGYAPSCIYLGRLYRDGRKVKKDYTKAKEEFAKACELNNRLGCKEERILNELKHSGYAY